MIAAACPRRSLQRFRWPSRPVSFPSPRPCVLPLVPGYLAFLTGAAGRLEGRSGRGRAFIGSIAFIVGFTIVFVSFGALFGDFGQRLNAHERILEIVFGVVTIGLGFFFAGFWPSSWLNRERRVHHLPRATVVGAAALGFTFGLGWTPCIGPTLSAILLLASASLGRHGAAWFDPGPLLLRRSRHPLFGRGARDGVDVRRVDLVAATRQSDWSRRWTAAHRDRYL